ncbi:excinuclease ABC subunit UvrC [Candidatus Mesenet endosymbiont of Agriotes lineatus]|uniref:excinuclease ABC subunit UvrC n=1 Tax=Candidatus Mesenet endosymbiont of Agriotes lineatus TaxID=3077948 RepID=UPI0030CAE6FA
MLSIGIEIVRQQAKISPQKCGIYKMLDVNGNFLYIGKAKNLNARLSDYLRTNTLAQRIKAMITQVAKIEVIVTQNEAEALLLEAQLIKALKPHYNIMLKDDKSYPYIAISQHEYPRISKYRGHLKDGYYYYGPFPSVSAVNNAIISICKTFLLRTCSDRNFSSRARPCIEYQIKRCSAPCVQKISQTNYINSVKQAQKTLSGRSKEVQMQLLTAMKQHSKNMNYELAAMLRDRLRSLQAIQMKTIDFCFPEDADFIGIAEKPDSFCVQVLSFRNGYHYSSTPYFLHKYNNVTSNEILTTFIMQFYKANIPNKIFTHLDVSELNVVSQALSKIAGHQVEVLCAKSDAELELLEFANNNAKQTLVSKSLTSTEILEKLKGVARVFSLSYIPERIEVYDNSHISGNQQVGVMIVAGRDGFLRNEYRKFSINTSKKSDDYAMIEEVLKRRFSGKIKDVVPDLLLIDGGPGHLSIVSNILKKLQLNIPFFCMAKGPNRNAGCENFYMLNKGTFTLKKDDKIMLYLQLLRNEAHRFAITAHRKKRDKLFMLSQLNEVPGIGRSRKKALLSYFGSMQAIKNASLLDIKNVPGINEKLAQIIFDYLSNN